MSFCKGTLKGGQRGVFTMFFRKNKNNKKFDNLLKESQQLAANIKSDPTTKLKVSNEHESEYEIAKHINSALTHLNHRADDTELRLNLVTEAIDIGLWDMTVVA